MSEKKEIVAALDLAILAVQTKYEGTPLQPEGLRAAAKLYALRDAIKAPSQQMLIAARDWSYGQYGRPIGDAAAIGCWTAMTNAIPDTTTVGEGR